MTSSYELAIDRRKIRENLKIRHFASFGKNEFGRLQVRLKMHLRPKSYDSTQNALYRIKNRAFEETL